MFIYDGPLEETHVALQLPAGPDQGTQCQGRAGGPTRRSVQTDSGMFIYDGPLEETHVALQLSPGPDQGTQCQGRAGGPTRRSVQTDPGMFIYAVAYTL